MPFGCRLGNAMTTACKANATLVIERLCPPAKTTTACLSKTRSLLGEARPGDEDNSKNNNNENNENNFGSGRRSSGGGATAAGKKTPRTGDHGRRRREWSLWGLTCEAVLIDEPLGGDSILVLDEEATVASAQAGATVPSPRNVLRVRHRLPVPVTMVLLLLCSRRRRPCPGGRRRGRYEIVGLRGRRRPRAGLARYRVQPAAWPVVRQGQTPVLQASGTTVRGHYVVVEVHAERIHLYEVVALGARRVRVERPTLLVESDVTLRVHDRLVPEVPTVVRLVELAHLVPFVFRL